jgi:hypothetical protein
MRVCHETMVYTEHKFIIQQTLPSRIHRQGSVYLRHLGEGRGCVNADAFPVHKYVEPAPEAEYSKADRGLRGDSVLYQLKTSAYAAGRSEGTRSDAY